MQLLAYPSNLYPQKIDFAAFLPLQAVCTLARQLLPWDYKFQFNFFLRSLMKKALLLCALGAATLVLAAGPALADSFTVTFSGSQGSGHNQSSISGSVNFDASATGGAITDPTGSINFTSGETHPFPDNFHTATYNVAGLSEFGPNTFTFADNTLVDNGGDYSFDNQGLGLDLSGFGPDVNLHGTKASDGSIDWFIVFYNQVDTTWSITETITDNTAATQPPSATPEPGSLALLGTAILGGAGALRRRFKA
jgi:hypothetical protein